MVCAWSKTPTQIAEYMKIFWAAGRLTTKPLSFWYKFWHRPVTNKNAPRSAQSKGGAKFFSDFGTHLTMWIKENAAFHRKLAEATGQHTHPNLDKMGVLWYYKLVST